jgi:dienelactone hydrolase
MKAQLVSFCMAVCLAATVASPEDFPRGRVVSRVECAVVAGQSYALYLPGAYDPSKKWPALYAFDPMGEGARPAKLLRPAAEKYGYVIFASNNSRNGPIAPSLEAMQAVWVDSHQRFSIDNDRIYAAGFSGAARIAMRFGLGLPGRVRGVIAAGAGLPLDLKPASPLSFAVYAVVGIRDFNYPEMKNLDRQLAAWGVPHHLEVTGQDHSWPSQEVFMRSVEWMELQGIKTRLLAPDADLTGKLFTARLERVRELKRAGRITDAYGESESILVDFQGLNDVSQAEALKSEIEKSVDIKKLLRREEKREAHRERLDAKLTTELALIRVQIADPTTDAPALQRSIAELDTNSLRREAANNKDEDRRIVAFRQTQRILVVGYEDAMLYFDRGEPARALASLELAALVRPDSPDLQFLMARAMALTHQEKKALKALGKAADLGWDSPERIENEPAFAPLRQDPEYAETLAKIRSRLKKGNP